MAGCMYPKEMRKENQITAKESILLVQNAVDQYKEKNGVLPIKNSEMSTPVYEKYVLDLKKLTQGPYLGQMPGIAFENGGSSMFVLVHAETKPEVKLLDVAAYQKTGDIQKWVDEYKSSRGGDIPKGEPAGTNVYRLDFAKLGKKLEQQESPYSRQYLGFLVDRNGTVAIDYAPEIMQAMERKGMKSADAQTDLRELLVESAPYVPVKSFPYYWIDNEPKATAP
ncbi:hypothetical protein DLM86_10360 [Paenibacillus flagellatus]|uniref:Uncharacterized protein n=2 Tax=Paenibacillus flagellatus TaxID=2211139 RepID=A0A2V5KBB1_9BACL|nr:hypothetical protein DLM86_10360 [Paenibacillus flagellatus]